MRFFVAVFLVLTTFSSGAVTLGQTPPRRTTQNSAPKPKSDTIKICQGIPIPDGYVVIAYMTSTACSHGAYLLKKQNDYETSLAVNGGGKTADESATPAKPAASKPTASSGQASRATSPANVKSARGSKTSSQSPAKVDRSEPATASSTTRPRRSVRLMTRRLRRKRTQLRQPEPSPTIQINRQTRLKDRRVLLR
jgi:hypothetical protein